MTNQFETKYKYDVSYVNEFADFSLGLFRNYAAFTKFNKYRRKTPLDVYHVARLATFKNEDCGKCLQLNIRMALEEGVEQKTVKQVVSNPENLSSQHKLVHDFTLALLNDNSDLNALSDEVEKIFGREVLVEISVCVATCRVYPTMKKGMGYSKECALLDFSYEQ